MLIKVKTLTGKEVSYYCKKKLVIQSLNFAFLDHHQNW